ncbi:RHS repeat domain-containing protein [Xanthomonas tesorieronis]|uniref:RHS repeat domain-containing protein n=1 Tax=Xanthomonas tesorieronis TaxID=3160839 RepID=UPI003516EFAE
MSIGHEMKGSGKRLTKLLWLLGLALPLHAAAETVEYVHTDALGTPIAITDASGNLIETSEYEPYGKLLNRPVTDGPGFTGHVQDAATGLTYMQQRYYDPLIGRFLSVDPVRANSISGSNFNRYWYGNNNPYRFFDPDGRCTGSHITNYDDTCKSTGEFTTKQESTLNIEARNPSSVFTHASVASNNPADPANPSPMPKETKKALTKFLSTKIGGRVGRYAVMHKAKVAMELITPQSGFDPDFRGGLGGGNAITYTLDVKGYLDLKGNPPELKGATLDVLLAHEIGHTSIGSSAVGYKSLDDGGILDEVNTVKIFENPYRRDIGFGYREAYSGHPVE